MSAGTTKKYLYETIYTKPFILNQKMIEFNNLTRFHLNLITFTTNIFQRQSK